MNLILFQLGAELGSRAISHLEEVSEEGIEAMAKAGVIAVLLPTTAYILRLKTPPARDMIKKGEQKIAGQLTSRNLMNSKSRSD